ncbi:serine/threonine protein kinase [Ureibacillus sp. GCM10028918]|uniref:serine/threonine protein kinase n=1 Tax=Ureibacillus sp. GCM10028918 TaxID=3273429 RepID=UPI00362054D0
MRAIRKFYQFLIDKPIEIGTVMNDHYEILRVIGTGSYGIVYLCKDLITNENRVIKQLRPSKGRNKQNVEMFEKEISLLRKLDHKKIPMLYEAFSSNGHLFYVMSFVEGDNLEELIFSKKLTFNEKESLLLLTQMLEFIDYLHIKDIYHQDLRIPNVLIRNKELYLIDLGLAKSPNHPKDTVEMKQQDYYDLGEILLYLLYTTYSSNKKKALPWTEELSLEKETIHLLKRLLQIKKPYSNTREISIDLHTALIAKEKVQ